MSSESIAQEVTIVGCGWYGRPLAVHLREHGCGVKGSKSTRDGVAALRADGIEGYLLRLEPNPEAGVDDALLDAEVLIVNIPPRRRPDIERFYMDQMQALTDLVAGSRIDKVIFVSSTSVYPEVNRIVSEDDDLVPEKPAGRALKNAERLWRENPHLQTTVLRFAGLVGKNRDPGRFLAGKKDVGNGDAPVNLIHLDDCLAITREILYQGAWGETFNACSPLHPSRRDFYTAAARKSGLTEPSFSREPTTAFKQIDSSLLSRRLGYEFRHPDPLKFP